MTTLPNGRTPAPTGEDGALSFADRPRVTLACTVVYRGRQLVVSAEGMGTDQFCDLLDKRFGPPSAAPLPNPTIAATDEPPKCQNRNCSNYDKPMAEGKYSRWACRGKDAISGNQKGYCRSQAN